MPITLLDPDSFTWRIDLAKTVEAEWPLTAFACNFENS
jgi:hypothetical protein